VGRVDRIELTGLAGAALLAIGVFLPWYHTSSNPASSIDGHRGSLSCWDVHPVLRWLLLVAAIGPVILTYIVLTNQQLSWARGEMTMVGSIAAFGLIAYNGIVDRPGTLEVGLRIGWFVSLVGSVLMVVGAAQRSMEAGRPRKPPGVI
jgi:hypothetical protein